MAAARSTSPDTTAAGKQLPLNGITVVNNRFGHTSSRYSGRCAIVDDLTTKLVVSTGNVWDITGNPVTIYSAN